MSLLTQLARYFDNKTRQRGDAYCRGGRVSIDSLSETAVLASVRGTAFYSVAVQREARDLTVSCTCPYAEEAACKHIWAVLLTVQDEPVLQGGQTLRFSLVDQDHAGDDDHGLEAAEGSYVPVSRQTRPSAKPRAPAKPNWRNRLQRMAEGYPSHLSRPGEWPSNRELLYVIDAPATRANGRLCLHIFFREPKKDGSWGKPKSRPLEHDVLNALPEPADRRILTFLSGAQEWYGSAGYGFSEGMYYGGADDYYYQGRTIQTRYYLVDPQTQLLLPMLCETGRCRLRLGGEDDVTRWPVLAWDDGDAWQFRIEMRRANSTGHYEVTGFLRRGAESMELGQAAALSRDGVFLTESVVARYEHHGAFSWVSLLREQGPLSIPANEGAAFVSELMRQPSRPAAELPSELRYEEIRLPPQARLRIKPGASWERDKLIGELSFGYADVVVAHDEPSGGIVHDARRQVVLRDMEAERMAQQQLVDLGWRRGSRGYGHSAAFSSGARRLSATVEQLLREGWHVEAEGRIYRHAVRFDTRVQSGVDWFELHGEAQFGDVVAHLPELLTAMRKGERFVKLGDGTFGVLPEQWLQRYGGLVGAGTAHEDHVRFARTQAGLLDALLAQQPEVRCDEAFARLRKQLQSFGGIGPEDPPRGFHGELRPYQREALGWFNFLRQYGFGGCLADDMGLGKTVQVLALLEARRELLAGQPKRNKNGDGTSLASPSPSLVVMPRSLIFNWKQEAARFTPQLRVLDHTGAQRQKGAEHFEQWDVILTTYGTLRRDAADFKDARFDYVILDEAQAIKNAASESAKAVRLLQAEHRLALSGTPIENHVGELWSLFEFLSPGMLGGASVFKAATAGSPDEDARRLLAHALRPFILRRTKEQVARELPAKLEQTLYCELEGRQRKRYGELRDHYRDSLRKRIAADGINRSKIQILEALLRLRQAAIHPGLLDRKFAGESSAKLDMLLPRLAEIADEGHKVLVFSQFTEMLAILRAELDRMDLAYEYLDGKTRDRQSRVERFQCDPECRLFLVSLKAGGVGLNLTAAQYVFLLDPWWNPAVEAQAIDRTHRIGQTQQVFAYRLIARDTVEERILELQTGKRSLADAIINADNALIRNLGREDLELLLS